MKWIANIHFILPTAMIYGTSSIQRSVGSIPAHYLSRESERKGSVNDRRHGGQKH